MPSDADTALSKFLSYVLRHKPDAIHLSLDKSGWASVDELVAKAEASGVRCHREDLLRVARHDSKQRFTLSEDLAHIRAAQGHSIPIDLGLTPSQPPDLLYHGTSTKVLEAILRDGLKQNARQFVHLSTNEELAKTVGQRHGPPIVLTIAALEMFVSGFEFFRADNGVWLTKHVPREFVTVVSDDAQTRSSVD